MFEMVKSDNIKIELFNIGQLRAEDGNYIVKYIYDQMNDVIVQTLNEYEGEILIPYDILNISK